MSAGSGFGSSPCKTIVAALRVFQGVDRELDDREEV